MAGEVDERAWEELGRTVQGELAAWGRANPRATLAASEAATDAALRRRQARYLADLVAASPSADLAPAPPADRPRCPACGGALEARGRKARAVLTPGQAEPVPIARSCAVCRSCGAGLVPPG